MSRSIRKTPIIGNVGSSEKKDKQIANQKFRKKEKNAILKKDLDHLPFDMDGVHNKYDMSKDGKHFINPNSDCDYTREYYKDGKWRRK